MMALFEKTIGILAMEQSSVQDWILGVRIHASLQDSNFPITNHESIGP